MTVLVQIANKIRLEKKLHIYLYIHFIYSRIVVTKLVSVRGVWFQVTVRESTGLRIL
jgi:hypothetical protein